MRKERFADVASIETPDAATVVFKLKGVNASFLTLLASPFNCIYSAAKLKENPRYPDTEVMGSGAYRLVEHVRGSHITGKRNEDYFKKDRPYIDGYKGYFVKSTSVVPGLLGGQFDAEFRGQNPSERDQLLAKAKERWVVHESSWSTVMLLIFNTTKKPFDDIRVRQALSLAIDRYTGGANLSKISIMKHVGGLMRPGSEWALPQADLEKLPGFSRDIEKSRAEARRLLKEAGAENLKIKLFNRNLPEPYTPTGIFVIDEWRKIGVATEHAQVETKMYFENLVSGSFDVALWPATEPADDPTAQLYYFLTHAQVDDELRAPHRRQARRDLREAVPLARCRRAQAAGERVRSPRHEPGLLRCRSCGGTASSCITRRSRAGPCRRATSRAPTWSTSGSTSRLSRAMPG